MMAMPDTVLKKRLDGLWKQIEKSHFSYLNTDDCPEKINERQKLEGYILDLICIIHHKDKFLLPETLSLMTRSAHSPEFNAYRLARGWAAIARYAGNLYAQPWRKEYRTLRLYSGFFKHEVEGSGLVDVEEIFNVMGYKRDANPHSLSLDGPVCPTQVMGISLDSLIAYVECQVMIQIWEEVSRRGRTCSWLEILRCRESCASNIDGATKFILDMQRNSISSDLTDLYSNVKLLDSNNPQSTNKYYPYQTSTDTTEEVFPPACGVVPPQFDLHPRGLDQVQNYEPHYMQPIPNGFAANTRLNSGHAMMQVKPGMLQSDHTLQHMPVNSMIEDPGMYSMNPVMPNHINAMYRYPVPNMMYPYNEMGNFMYQPMPVHPAMMPPYLPTYFPVRQANMTHLTNGHHCPTRPAQTYCTSVPTGQLIELDNPSYPVNNHNTMTSPKQTIHLDKLESDQNVKAHGDLSSQKYSADFVNGSNNVSSKRIVCESANDTQDSVRRNSAPKSAVYSNDHPVTIPRSDTQPSLSKAREDGMGTFESWDYVFRNLENQGYSKDLGDRGNQIPSPLESKTLGRSSSRDPKRYQQTTMDLEDALHAMSLEKDSDEDMYRTAKVNETLNKLKQVSEAKAAKANLKRQLRADEREKRKCSSHETNGAAFISENNAYNRQSDKTRLISREDALEKKEIDKSMAMNGYVHDKGVDSRKVKKSIVKCLSSETDTVNGRKKSEPTMQNGSVAKKSSQPQVSGSHPAKVAHSDTVDSAMKSRLVVVLHSPEKSKQSFPQQGGAKGEHNAKSSADRMEGKGAKSKSEAWECGTCTYLNQTPKNICEVCGKSRQIGVEAVPLVSGGKECPRCTLVNNRDATVCSVCDTSLEHSPTYI